MSTAQGERRLHLQETRSLLFKIPLNELFELPGRPHVVYQIRSYASMGDANIAAATARSDLPFLFKAFETGQIGPKKMAKMHGGNPRIATIHEYLDWTVSAQTAETDDELDFAGFRVLVILPRYVPQWPPEGYAGCKQGVKNTVLSGPLPPLPILQTHGRPVCAATIRSGPGYLEIPFVATQEGKRGRGYCRCLVEAIEAICRVLQLKKLMLCSTNDFSVRSTWQHLGFNFTTEEEMEAKWDIPHSDLVYLQNTAQMYKDLPGTLSSWKPVVIKHGSLQVRTYARIGEGRPSIAAAQLPPCKRQRGGGAGGGGGGSTSCLIPASSNATSMFAGGGSTFFLPSASEASTPAHNRQTASRCVSAMTGGSGDQVASRELRNRQECPEKGPSARPACDQEVDGRPEGLKAAEAAAAATPAPTVAASTTAMQVPAVGVASAVVPVPAVAVHQTAMPVPVVAVAPTAPGPG